MSREAKVKMVPYISPVFRVCVFMFLLQSSLLVQVIWRSLDVSPNSPSVQYLFSWLLYPSQGHGEAAYECRLITGPNVSNYGFGTWLKGASAVFSCCYEDVLASSPTKIPSMLCLHWVLN